MEALEYKHAPIAKHFCTGAGIDLQYHDSIIAEAILVFFAKHNIACLPVHDSFIIDCRYHMWLDHLMRVAFRKYFGHDCSVKPKKFIMHEAIEQALDELYNRRIKANEIIARDDDPERSSDYTYYDKMLREFAEAKGATIEAYEFRSPTDEELMQVRDDLKREYEQLQRLSEKIDRLFPALAERD